MKMLLATMTILFFSASRAFAHEGEAEVTNVAEAEWVGPLTAVVVIAAAIILARIIRRGSNRHIINQHITNTVC